MSIATLSAALQRSVAGDPWHGSSLEALLADVTPDESAAHPIAGAHSIAEVVTHLANWMDEVASWLEGHARSMTDERDWAPPGPWPRPRQQMMAAHGRLLRALQAFPESRLGELAGATPLPFEEVVIGAAEHNAYHGGQIGVLKRALRG